MDTHSSHLIAPVRSRSSQSPSPSHSASASATSSIHKRKLASEDHAPPFPSSFSDTRDGALTSNDDLESISARGADSDSEDESEEVADDDEEYDESSMRTFTASRLENSGAPLVRNTKLKADNSVKVEPNQVVKDTVSGGSGNSVAAPAGGSVSGVVVKDEAMRNIFTENLQTSGAYIAREESLKREEEAGRLKFVCVSNDGVDDHMIWLIGLKNIFARQLPNMPRDYIVRLVMDRNHKSVMVIRRNQAVGGTTYQVVGGITYRPYLSQKFGEIAFCAITADEQVKGYGTRLMNHLKQFARDDDGLTHFLTYADNNAVGYFVKQGFTKEIYLEKERWQGYIKDYDGGILMECKIDPKLPYTNLSTMIRRQRQAIDEKIRELSNCHIIYQGMDFQKKEAGIPRKAFKVEDIAGLREAGWTSDQYGYSRFKAMNLSDQKLLATFMRSLVKVGEIMKPGIPIDVAAFFASFPNKNFYEEKRITLHFPGIFLTIAVRNRTILLYSLQGFSFCSSSVSQHPSFLHQGKSLPLIYWLLHEILVEPSLTTQWQGYKYQSFTGIHQFDGRV